MCLGLSIFFDAMRCHADAVFSRGAEIIATDKIVGIYLDGGTNCVWMLPFMNWLEGLKSIIHSFIWLGFCSPSIFLREVVRVGCRDEDKHLSKWYELYISFKIKCRSVGRFIIINFIIISSTGDFIQFALSNNIT